MATHVIVFAGIKGGIGKSTCAINIAVTLANQKKRVLIMDANVRQYTSSAFIAFRNSYKKDIDVEVIKDSNITENLATNEQEYEQYDYIIIDSGGTSDSFTRGAMIAAGYGILILPIQPSLADIWALEDTLKILTSARKVTSIQAYVLINMLPSKTRLLADTLESLQDFSKKYDFSILKQTLGIRADFKGAFAKGQGVTEFSSSNKAAKEIKALVQEIKKLSSKG